MPVAATTAAATAVTAADARNAAAAEANLVAGASMVEISAELGSRGQSKKALAPWSGKGLLASASLHHPPRKFPGQAARMNVPLASGIGHRWCRHAFQTLYEEPRRQHHA